MDSSLINIKLNDQQIIRQTDSHVFLDMIQWEVTISLAKHSYQTL